MKKGFTLIEVLAVVMILGILSAVAIPVVSKIIKESKNKKIYYSINSIVDSVNISNIEGTEDCWYRAKNDSYKLPNEISSLDIILFRENGNYKYGVYATYEGKDIVYTSDFKSLDPKKSEDWVKEDDNFLENYLNIESNDIEKILDMDINYCKLIGGNE